MKLTGPAAQKGNEMKKAALLGLSKLLTKAAKEVRDDVEPGEYKINATVALQVYGTLTVKPDQTYIPTSSIPYKTALALFVRYCGITRETALGHLERAMHEAYDWDRCKDEGEETPTAAELLAGMADLTEAEERVQRLLEELPEGVRKGSVSVAELEYCEIKPAKKRGKAA